MFLKVNNTDLIYKYSFRGSITTCGAGPLLSLCGRLAGGWGRMRACFREAGHLFSLSPISPSISPTLLGFIHTKWTAPVRFFQRAIIQGATKQMLGAKEWRGWATKWRMSVHRLKYIRPTLGWKNLSAVENAQEDQDVGGWTRSKLEPYFRYIIEPYEYRRDVLCTWSVWPLYRNDKGPDAGREINSTWFQLTAVTQLFQLFQ